MQSRSGVSILAEKPVKIFLADPCLVPMSFSSIILFLFLELSYVKF